MSEANKIAWRKRICRKILSKKAELKEQYPSNWDVKLNQYVKKHNPQYRPYFDFHWNLIDSFMLDDD